MVAYNKFQSFVEELVEGTHNFEAAGDQVFVALIDDTPGPVNTNTVWGDLSTNEITGTGYTAGGEDVQNDTSRTGGTVDVTAVDVVWTAGAADWTAFRYVICYNDTPTSPADPLICWWDYTSNVTLGNGETFTVDFQNNRIFQLT